MAKRFIDTELFDDPWFMDLSVSGKLFWIYCITKCDHAGILELNKKLCQFQTGIKSIETVIKELSNRLICVKEQYYFIPKYIEFQYPGFPNSKVRQQARAIEILKKYNLINEDILTVKKELTNTYDNDNESVNVNVNEKNKDKNCLMRNSGVTVDIIKQSFGKSKDLIFADYEHYYNMALAWSNSKGMMRIDWVATVANFARGDIRDGKLKIKKKSRVEVESAPKDFGIISSTATKMPDSLKKSISNIGET